MTPLTVPLLSLLHRLTAPIPFPVAEPLAVILLLIPLTGLRRGPGAFLRRLSKTALALLLALAALWGPAVAVPAEALPTPDARQLAWLCGNLIHTLEAAAPDFPDPADALKTAPAAAGMPGCAVKAARCPAWLSLSHAWGAFIPLTGEAIVDPAEPAPLAPFTAVHELMHLSGIADEGAANVAAWERCLDFGGPFADSARLWALRYAMGRLRAADPAAWGEMRAKMEGALLRTFLDCGAEAEPPRQRLSPATGDYAALAGYLAGE